MRLSAADVVTVVLIAGCWAAGTGTLGWLATRRLRARSVRAAVVSLGALTLVVTLAAVMGTAQAMFLSAHDLQVTMLVSAVVAVLALTGAVLVSRMVSRDQRRLSVAVRALGAGQPVTGPVGGASPEPRLAAELAEVHAELVRAGQRLAQARDAERGRARVAREMLTAVSHDLRTPLAGLRAMAEALEDGVVADPGEYHTRIRVTVDRLGQMIDGLLDLTLARSDIAPAQNHPVALADVVSDCLAGLHPVASRGGVSLSGTAEDGLEVLGNGAALARALDNLVLNAITATPAGGRVAVELARLADTARIRVTDTGPGIPAADLDRIFDVGFRGRDSAGTGLGLAIARALVASHGGQVSAASPGRGAGGGAEVTMILPLGPGRDTTGPDGTTADYPPSPANSASPAARVTRGAHPSSATNLSDDAVM